MAVPNAPTLAAELPVRPGPCPTPCRGPVARAQRKGAQQGHAHRGPDLLLDAHPIPVQRDARAARGPRWRMHAAPPRALRSSAAAAAALAIKLTTQLAAPPDDDPRRGLHQPVVCVRVAQHRCVRRYREAEGLHEGDGEEVSAGVGLDEQRRRRRTTHG